MSSRLAWAGVTAGSAVAAIVFSLLAFRVAGPLVFGDEVRYFEAGTSLANGEGLRIREAPYRFGPVYPAVIALVLAIVENRLLAYQVLLFLNGLLVASSAIPVFLLARRLLTAESAAIVALASLFLPVSVFAATVMTECLAYVAALWAIFAMQLALERPTIGRQVACLGACAVATAIRPQLVTLLGAFLLALAVRYVVSGSRWSLRRVVQQLWPTGVALIAAAIALVRIADDPSSVAVFGAYGELWGRYEAVEVARWAAYHAFDLALYVMLVPVLVLPAALAHLVRLSRRGGRGDAAFVSVFVAAVSVQLGVMALFSTTPGGEARLHDRYAIYIVPLWLVLLTAWIVSGAPRTRVTAGGGIALLITILALGPFQQVTEKNPPVDQVGTVLWARVDETVGHGRTLLFVAATAAILGFLLLRARRAWALLAVVVAGVSLSTGEMWAWATRADGLDGTTDPRAASRLWIDRAVRDHTGVLGVYVGTRTCDTEDVRNAFLVSEMFNASVGPVTSIGSSLGFLPELQVHLGDHGSLLDQKGEPLVAEYVLVPAGVEVDGRPIASGTGANLVLWRVNGPIRLRGSTTLAAVERVVCGAGSDDE